MREEEILKETEGAEKFPEGTGTTDALTKSQQVTGSGLRGKPHSAKRGLRGFPAATLGAAAPPHRLLLRRHPRPRAQAGK